MKIKSKQYAIALFQSLDDKNTSTGSVPGGEEIIKNFTKFLVDNNDFSRLEEILSYFTKMRNEKEGITEAEIIFKKDMDKKVLKYLKDFIQKKQKSKSVVITERQDKNILGGVIIRYGDKSIDLSLSRKVSKLKNYLIN